MEQFLGEMVSHSLYPLSLGVTDTFGYLTHVTSY